MTWQTEGDAALLKVVLQTFDHGPVWRQAKPPNATNKIIGHIRRFGSSENELVNSYGVNGVEIICQAELDASVLLKMNWLIVTGSMALRLYAKPIRFLFHLLSLIGSLLTLRFSQPPTLNHNGALTIN